MAIPGKNLHTVKKPVRVPADIKGMKITTMGTDPSLMKAAGGAGLVLPSMDWYMGPERGLTEGMFMHWAGFYGYKLYEATKYHTLFGEGGPEEMRLWGEYTTKINDDWIKATEAKGFPARKAYEE